MLSAWVVTRVKKELRAPAAASTAPCSYQASALAHFSPRWCNNCKAVSFESVVESVIELVGQRIGPFLAALVYLEAALLVVNRNSVVESVVRAVGESVVEAAAKAVVESVA